MHELPTPLSREAIREIDRRAIEDFGIPGAVLMENAGRGAAHIILGLLRGPAGARIAVVCGGGNNGGDGFVIARHLANADAAPEIFLAADPKRLPPDAAINYGIVSRMDLPIYDISSTAGLNRHLAELQKAQIVVDALLGTGFIGRPRPPIDDIIRAINDLPSATVVAVDVPSGLDCNTGLPADPTIRADCTITFVAPKAGFDTSGATGHTGKIHVVDIGAPRRLIREVAKNAQQKGDTPPGGALE